MRIKGRSSGHVALFGTLLVAACSGGDEPVEDDPACLEVAAPAAGPSTGDHRFVSTISVVDLRDFREDSAGARVEAHVGRITATFADFEGVGTSTPADQLVLGERCVGIVSRPSSASPTGVAIDEVTVSGTARGAVTVPPTGAPGVYLDIGDPLLDGASTLTAAVTSSGDFAPFEVDIEAAQPLVVETPRSDGTGAVLRSAMRVRWNAGNGDAVVVRVTPEVPAGGVQSGGQVICQVVDDGCFDVPASATTFLLSANVETYGLLVSRVRAVGEEVDADTVVVLRSAAEWTTDLVNGVFE